MNNLMKIEMYRSNMYLKKSFNKKQNYFKVQW